MDSMTIVSLAGIGAIAYAFKIYIIDIDKEIERNREERKNIIVDPQTKKRNVPDFYGVNKLRDDPEGFGKNLLKNQEKLERGEEVAVDAATALYLMRNSKHHDLIVGETGTINMKTLSNNVVFDEDHIKKLQDHLMNFQPPQKAGSVVTPRTPPGYVKEIQDVKGGGIRWVFEDWHAEECGIKSVCYDRCGRAMPDPDEVSEDNKKNSRRQQPQLQDNQQGQQIDMNRKLTRLIEMQEESRVDVMLAVGGKVSALENALEDEIKSPIKSALTPHEFKDDIASIEEELAIPDFSLSFKDSLVETETNEEVSLELDVEKFQEELLPKNDAWKDANYIEDEEGEELENPQEEFFEYEDMDRFLKTIATCQDFTEKVFASVFSKKGVGSIFIDFVEKEIFVEKNYFSRCINEIIDTQERKKFELDFLTKESVEIYDGNKMNELFLAMNDNDYFLTYGRGQSRVIFNVLFELEEIEGVYLCGWYLKMKLTAHEAIADFIKSYSRGTSISIIASTPKEISARLKMLKGVKRTY